MKLNFTKVELKSIANFDDDFNSHYFLALSDDTRFSDYCSF